MSHSEKHCKCKKETNKVMIELIKEYHDEYSKLLKNYDKIKKQIMKLKIKEGNMFVCINCMKMLEKDYVNKMKLFQSVNKCIRCKQTDIGMEFILPRKTKNNIKKKSKK